MAWRAEESGAALLFFGQAYRNIYTDRNVYWLEPGSGLAMAVFDTFARGHLFAELADVSSGDNVIRFQC